MRTSVAAYRGEQSAAVYLAGETGGVPNRQIALEELLMVWLANGNPAFGQYHELFEDTPLADGSAYQQLIDGLREHFRTQPGFGPDGDDLISLLQRPAREAGGSLTEQLRWISGACAATAKNTGPIDATSNSGTHSASCPGAGGAMRAMPIGSHSAATSSSAPWIIAWRRSAKRPSQWA